MINIQVHCSNCRRLQRKEKHYSCKHYAKLKDISVLYCRFWLPTKKTVAREITKQELQPKRKVFLLKKKEA